MAMITTEHAAGTAWLLPRNCVARSPARVELCMPVHTEIVLQTGSSCLCTNAKEFQKNSHEGTSKVLLVCKNSGFQLSITECNVIKATGGHVMLP